MSESESNQVLEKFSESEQYQKITQDIIAAWNNLQVLVGNIYDSIKNYFEKYCEEDDISVEELRQLLEDEEKLEENEKMKSEIHKFTYHGEPISFKTIAVNDNIIAELMAREGYAYLPRKDGDPVEFIGDIAVKEAIGLQELMGTEVPINLTFRELCLLTTMIDENYTERYERFGIMNCKRKLCEGIKTVDNKMSKKENG